MTDRFRRRPGPAARRAPGRAALLAAAVGGAVALTGCSGPTVVGAGGASTGATTGTTTLSAGTGASGVPSGAPDPNAPESVAPGDIPDNQVYVPFSPAGAGFTVSVPQGWARSSDGAATVFTDKYNSVRVESRPAPAGFDQTYAEQQEVPALQRSVPGFSSPRVSTVQRSAGSAVLLTYAATSAPNPVTGRSAGLAVERYEFAGHGQEVIVTLSGARGADNVDPWRTVTDSFRWQA